LLLEPMTHELFKGVFITVAFFLGSIFLPVIGVLISIFTPLPIIIYYYQYGRKVALQLIVITTAVVTTVILALKIPSLFLYLMQLLLLGFICGELLSNNFNIPKIIIVRGVTEEQLKWLSESLDTMIPWLAKLFPAIITVATAIIIWLNLIIAKHFLFLRLRQIPPPLQDLILWKTPDYLVWIPIAAGFGAILPTGSIKIVSYNVLLVMGAVYFFQGLAIIAYYFETRKTPRSIRFLAYFFIFFQQILTIVVSILGFMDVWANFRKLSENSGGNGDTQRTNNTVG